MPATNAAMEIQFKLIVILAHQFVSAAGSGDSRMCTARLQACWLVRNEANVDSKLAINATHARYEAATEWCGGFGAIFSRKTRDTARAPAASVSIPLSNCSELFCSDSISARRSER